MASKFYADGLKRLMAPIVASGNYVDFGVGSTNPTVVTDANYVSHAIGQNAGQLHINEDSMSTPRSVIYTNTNTVYYFDKVPGEGAATSHKDNDNLKWVLIRASSSILFEIALSNSGGLDVEGPVGDVPGNQVKLGQYTTVGSGRGIYIKISSAV